ncbi:MAG: hypothetical protein Q8O67_23965 [Deltaproteobacteria bacterium]|nr:hypothetical protein [Deltaproteobacteria bacterium]
MKRLASLFVVAVVGAGCFNLFFPFAPDQLFESDVRSRCAFAFRCCLAAERGSTGLSGFRNEDECIEELLETGGQLSFLGQRAKAVIDAGKGTHDAALADECLKPLFDARNACDAETVLAPTPESTECQVGASRAFVVGNVDDGDECIDDLECADEGRCQPDPDLEPDPDEVTVTVAGLCVAAASEGEACDERSCKAGLDCDSNDAGELECTKPVLLEDGADCFVGSQCESGSCVAEGGVGFCDFDGSDCTSDAQCTLDQDDFCDFDNGNTVCGPPADVVVEICDGK